MARAAVKGPDVSAGDRLVTAIYDALPVVDGTRYEFDARELAIVDLARAAAEDIAALEGLLIEQGASVTGSMGQDRLNPIFAELRLQRSSLSRILDLIRIPVERELPKSRRHQIAAKARWGRVDRVTERYATLRAAGPTERLTARDRFAGIVVASPLPEPAPNVGKETK